LAQAGRHRSQALLFSASVWWSWRHRNLMCLNNETWSSSRLSFNIRAMVETSRICFYPVYNDRLVDKHIKWNNRNHSCVILNVDVSCLSSPVRSGFGGIISNTFGHILQASPASFKAHMIYCSLNCMLSTRVSCWPKT
jgi:hypothetical protein